jgi:iron(III) transport system permease protein
MKRLLRACQESPAQAVCMALLALLVAGLIVYPLGLILVHSFQAEGGGAGLSQYRELLANRDVGAAAKMSSWLMLDVAIGCLALGVPLAWLVARTDMPGKVFVQAAAAIAFVIPSFINVISWIFLFAPNSGYLNKALAAALHLDAAPFNVFSFGGLVFIEVCHLFPIVFFAVSTALANADASHEQAARILGAGRVRTMLTITLPLVAPAIVSSVVLCVLDALSSFGAPAAIGTMANFKVVSTQIYQLVTFPPNLPLAAALAVPVAAWTLALLGVQHLFLRKNRFTTLTGKSSAPELVELGALRWPLAALVAVLLFCIAVLPLLGLVALSLLKVFGAELVAQNFALTHYRAVFDSSFTVLPAVKNSLVLATAAASVCVLAGLLLAWFIERIDFAGRGVAVGVVSVAFGIPSIILGIGVLLAYIGPLYGTLTIVLVAYCARHLPIAFVYTRALVKQLSPELEEAARVSGAGWARTLKDISFPVMRPGAFVAWLLIFSLCLREQPMSAILTQGDTGVMSTTVLQFIEDGSIEVAAAVAVLIVAVSMACLLVPRLLGLRPKGATT